MMASTIKPEHEAEPVPTFFLSENESIPRWNGPLLTIAQIMKYFVSSDSEAEMTALFLTAKEMVPLRHKLTEMGQKKPPSPL